MPEITIAQPLSIRGAGFDEYWLRDLIFENPACLQLGELDAIDKERQQSSGGRLDILLKNTDDDTMYEVEIMLGETDETHIIRTIEYWDNEKRRWPQRQHIAVLVAEHINRRFFNVIHLLSNSIPIIAIQAALIEVNGKRSVYFTTLLDTFEEIDDGTSLDNIAYDRDYWLKRSKWTLEAAEALQTITQPVFADSTLNYLKYYIAITVSGDNYMSLHKRSQNKSLLIFRLPASLQEEAAGHLDAKSITYVRKPKSILVTADKKMLEENKPAFIEIARLVKRAREA
jgi:hypothetical protein